MTSSHLGLSAIVTGGNSGIGRATAAKLMTEGAKVLVVDVQPEPSWTAEHLRYYQADVAAEDSPAGIVACAIDHFGQLDFLINNAGMVGGSEVENMADDVWDRILDVNLKAVFKLSRAAIPHLKNSSRGRIVNIGSIMSRLAGPGMGGLHHLKARCRRSNQNPSARAWRLWDHCQLYFTRRHCNRYYGTSHCSRPRLHRILDPEICNWPARTTRRYCQRDQFPAYCRGSLYYGPWLGG